MTAHSASDATGASVDDGEVARFAAMAETWWDPDGPFRPLHRLNPTRLRFVRDRLAAHFGRDPLGAKPLAGLRLLDIGCGGGLLCEPLARLGAETVGIDASEKNIAIARNHAVQSGLAIEYRHATAEALAAEGARFDAVLNLEVVEHVANVESFMAACCALVAPGGATVVATLNRTPKSFALAILGAEYLLNWLPRGTHDWRRFLRPSEVAAHLRRQGLTVAEIAGVTYGPLTGDWRLSRDPSVNYMIFATRGE